MGSMGHKTRDPTPAEIRKACKRLRDRWTEDERIKRAGEIKITWVPPACGVNEYDFPETLGETK